MGSRPRGVWGAKAVAARGQTMRAALRVRVQNWRFPLAALAAPAWMAAGRGTGFAGRESQWMP